MVEENPKFGLVYIDGSHGFEEVFSDFYFVRYPMACGYLLFDDGSDPEVAKVLHFLRRI